MHRFPLGRRWASILFGVASLILCASLSASSPSSLFVAGAALPLTCPAPQAHPSFSSLRYRPSDCNAPVRWTEPATAARPVVWPHPNPAMCATCRCPDNEQCTYSGGFCADNIVGAVSPLLPVSLGAAGGNASFTVATSVQARAVFRGSLCPGACHPFDALSLQLFTAKLNLASGCVGPATATISPTIAAADAFLAAHSWAGLPVDAPESSFPTDYLLDVQYWTRLLRTFNIAASPNGPCTSDAIEHAESSNPGSSAWLQQWNATTALCGVPTSCPDSTACAEAALSDEREQRFQPVCCEFVPPEPRVVAAAIPPYTPYIRIATSPKLDWPKLAYTQRDWERWDGFDYQSDFIAPVSPAVEPVTQIADTNALFTPLTSASAGATPTALSNPAASAAFVNDWTAELRGVLHRTFFASAYENWRGMNTLTSRPLLSDLFGPQAALYYFDPRLMHHNMSFSVNQMYSQHRSNVKRDIRATLAASGVTGSALETQTDAAWDSRSLNFRSDVPGIVGVADWFETYGRRHLSFQQLNQLYLTGSDGYRFNALGLWRSADGTVSDQTAARYDFRGSAWGSADIAFLYGHYMHLCSTDFIRRVRTMSMAALTAAYNVNAHPFVGDIDQFSQAQWLIRMTSFTGHAFNILRSETLLRARGASVTVYTTSNIQLGQWSNSDAINLANDRIRLVETRVRSAGLVEYLSSYHGLAMQSLEQGMIHAPSRSAFLSLDALYKLYHADLSLNYHPASNSLPGPSGRSYDLFSGSRSVSDRFDLPMYVQWAERPHCAQSLTRYSGTGDGTVIGSFTPTALCSANSLTVIPHSGNLAEVIQRLYSAAWHAAGHLYAPLDLLRNVVQSSPYRTNEQRYSTATLQQRSNFISPYIEMGFSGENYVAVPVGIFATARLGGQSGSPVVSDHNGRSNAVPFIRLFCELNDAPFSRAANPSVPGDQQQTLSRLVASAYQGFMLLSTFLTPQVGWGTTQANSPWQTTIIVPINVDAVYATTTTQNVRLPVTAGTAYALPTSTILTVRHQTQSVVIRLLRAEIHSASRISTVSSIRSVSYPANGLEPYALMWLVDSESYALGVGRLVVHHKHRNVAALAAYRTAWIWQGGRTNGDAEMSRLQANLRATQVTESFSNTNWNPANQPVANQPPTGIRSASTWTLSATSGGVTVALRRSDVYEPFGSATPYRDPPTGSAFVAPYYVDNLSRTVNGREILAWTSGQQPFRTIRHTNVWGPWLA